MDDVRFGGLTIFTDDDAGAGRVETFAHGSAGEKFFAANDERNLDRMAAVQRFPLGDDLLGPFAVLRQGEIGVSLIFQMLPTPGDDVGLGGRKLAVLGAARRGIGGADGVKCGEKTFFENVPFGGADFDLKGVAQKIFGTGVFIEAADEVADGIDEMFLVTGGRVEQEIAGHLEERAALVVGHAFEHFDLDAVQGIVLMGENQAVGKVEQIVRGETDIESREVFGLHRFVQQALVIGIRLEFGLIRSKGPAAHGGLGAFVFHVRAFDDANGDAAAASRHAPARPFLNLPHGPEGIGNVGLQGNPGPDVF